MMLRFVFLAFLIGFVPSEAAPATNAAEIVDISVEQVKSIGDSVELNCTINNPENRTVVWEKRSSAQDSTMFSANEKLLFSDPRFGVNVTNKSYILKIDRIQADDAATYICQIIITPTNKVSKQVLLLVRTPASVVTIKTGELPVDLGKPARLQCVSEGYPQPTVTWQRDSKKKLLSNGALQFVGEYLTIPNVTKEDRGLYECYASNLKGFEPAKTTATLDVRFPPQISVPRPKVAQAINYDIELECLVEAWPSPAIQWFKEGVELLSNSDYSIITTAREDETTSSILRVLTIESKQYGDYECKAQNALGHASARVNLFAHPIPDINHSGLEMPESATAATQVTSFVVLAAAYTFVHLL